MSGRNSRSTTRASVGFKVTRANKPAKRMRADICILSHPVSLAIEEGPELYVSTM